jgi:hypothetical protein
MIRVAKRRIGTRARRNGLDALALAVAKEPHRIERKRLATVSPSKDLADPAEFCETSRMAYTLDAAGQERLDCYFDAERQRKLRQ